MVPMPQLHGLHCRMAPTACGGGVMDELWEFILAWIITVGGFALLLVTIRLMVWFVDVIMLRGW